tara:strand:+ start:4798 stop:5133 length:336 start_codon:yes stop_codon:yes gene_type:complete
MQFLIKNKVYFDDSGILGDLESSSFSILSITDWVLTKSPLDKITIEMLEIINNVAIIAVDLVKKFPTDREVAKLSWARPRPKAPPSDLCIRISKIRTMARTMLIAIRIVSI